MKRLPILFFVTLAIGLLAASGPQAARLTDAETPDAEKASTPETRVTLDFRDVDIRVVAKFISELTGQNFIFDNRVREKVTVFSPSKVTPEEAYRLFETVLKVHGYTTVPQNGMVMVVPSQKARVMDVETRPTQPIPRTKDDRVITQIIHLRHADPTEMRTLLTPLMDKSGVIMAYESGDTLVITEYASNINRLMGIIRALDVPDEGAQLSVIDLHYASARNLATALEEILKTSLTRGKAQPAAGGIKYKVVPDERTNKLIVLARATELDTIRELVRRLDIPAPRGSDRVHVYFLKNAVAEDLAKTLNELAGQRSIDPGKGTGSTSPTRLLLQEDVFITADKATNSLIIRAERQDYLVIKNIIEQLDIQRAQVLVEAVIMEMSFKKALTLGAEWRSINFPESGGGAVGYGGTSLPVGDDASGLINQVASQPFGAASGLILGAAEGTLTYGGATYLNLGLLIQALQQDSEVNILSTPHLLTMDNEEARIVVGEERPFLKSAMTAETGAVNPAVTRTYEYKDLGLTLKMTPHITQGEFIKLELYQQILNFMSQIETGAISSTKRETETVVQVRDGETVVIGGLIRDDQHLSKSQVPCMGDIPVFGWLFKRRSNSSDKTNLLVLIKPTIIRTPDQLRELTRQKKSEVENSIHPKADEPAETPAEARPEGAE